MCCEEALPCGAAEGGECLVNIRRDPKEKAIASENRELWLFFFSLNEIFVRNMKNISKCL